MLEGMRSPGDHESPGLRFFHLQTNKTPNGSGSWYSVARWCLAVVTKRLYGPPLFRLLGGDRTVGHCTERSTASRSKLACTKARTAEATPLSVDWPTLIYRAWIGQCALNASQIALIYLPTRPFSAVPLAIASATDSM